MNWNQFNFRVFVLSLFVRWKYSIGQFKILDRTRTIFILYSYSLFQNFNKSTLDVGWYFQTFAIKANVMQANLNFWTWEFLFYWIFNFLTMDWPLTKICMAYNMISLVNCVLDNTICLQFFDVGNNDSNNEIDHYQTKIQNISFWLRTYWGSYIQISVNQNF